VSHSAVDYGVPTQIDQARDVFKKGLAVAVTLFHIVALSLLTLDPWLFLGTSAHLFCVLAFINYPALPRRPELSAVIDVLLSAGSVAVIIYLWQNVPEIYYRVGVDPSTTDVVVGTIATAVILEMARRCIGIVFPIMCLVLIVYAMYGNVLPGLWGHRGYEFDRTVSAMFSTEGLYGFSMDAAATYIVLFVTFGAFMHATGVGGFFINLATAVTQRSRGGPAKACVVGSALFGMVSGSSMGNVATVGTFTIPLMKRAGYPAAFAGAVEAAASTGGQLMPPIMGSVAFVLADATETPYREVMLAAAIPAICYFAAVFFVADFEAMKRGLLPAKDVVLNVWSILRKDGILIVPLLILLTWVVALDHSVVQSALLATAAAILVDLIRKRRIMPLKLVLNSLEQGSLGTLQAAGACAAAGVLVGIFGMTGLGNNFVAAMTGLGGHFLFPVLVLVMILTILMGFPLPTVPAYVITAMIGAPLIIKLGGVGMLAAHLFVMYYACVSTLTPPVALAAFAAASIAGADPYKTSWMAMRLSIAAYVVPFIIIYNPALIGHGAWYQIAGAIVSAIASAFALAAAVNSNYSAVLRLLMVVLVVPIAWPNLWINAAGVAALLIVSQIGRRIARNGSVPADGGGAVPNPADSLPR
jgi:TRAP transporter 4TM/12TM fusion protein